MPKQVQGYLTEDDTFFERAEDAEVYESEIALRLACQKLETSPGISVDDDKVIYVLENLEAEVLRYLQARAKRNRTDEREPEGYTEAIQQLKAGGDEPVSDIRRRKRSANV